MNKLPYLLITAASLIAVPACMAPSPGEESAPSEGPVGETSQAELNCTGSCTKNGGSGACLFNPNTLTELRTLAAGTLPSTLPSMPGIPLTSCRAGVLDHVIGCALEDRQSVYDPVTSTWIKGGVGIAPEWVNQPLTLDKQRWVTACVAQRLNAFGVHIDVVLEGNLPMLAPNASYEAAYPWNDSYVWGNIFAPSTSGIFVYACWDENVAQVCTDPPPSWYLNMRICDQSPNCGLQVVGACSDWCDSNPNAPGYKMCRSDGTPYDDHVIHAQVHGRKSCAFD